MKDASKCLDNMLTEKWTKLAKHPKQAALWRCPTRFAAVVAGRGSGKTELARRRIVRYLSYRPPNSSHNPIYFYALPTRDQAKRVAWQHIKELVPKEWVAKDGISETELSIYTIFKTKLYVVGMDKPERIEGEQWDGCVIDESCDHKPKTFDLSVLPALSHREGWCWRIGVPKRFGPGAQEFKAFYDSAKSDKDITAYTWKSSEILTPSQLRFARERLDDRDFKEQYEASWESTTGQIYFSFSDLNIRRDIKYNPYEPLIIGSDFNVDPMRWVYAHRYGNSLHVFDELDLRNSNTQEALNETYHRYGDSKGGFQFFGDASSRARKSAAAFSDYAQIYNDTRFENAQCFYPESNPPLVDRFASTNAMLKNAADEVRCYISENCRHLIDDLVNRSYRPGTRSPNDFGDRGHASDALGYIIHKLWPPQVSQIYNPGRIHIGSVN